ncbi:tetratricopeptide repeat protein [Kribbella ginsengisoli]|uniref:Tetratricopeptide repeat protein n=1 Tax=Kribbella ginsengisoli TaxID=363865 RepID=A0ABP6VJA8_9ACTN
MPKMTEKLRLLEALERRLAAFRSTADQDQILAPEVQSEVSALLQLINTPEIATERVAFALGWYHWWRHELLPDNDEDLVSAAFFVLSLTKHGYTGPFPAPLYVFQAALGLHFAADARDSLQSAAGDSSVLDEGIDLLHEALDKSPKEELSRGYWFFKLSIALQYRAREAASTDDYDYAIGCARHSLEDLPRQDPNWATYLANLGYLLQTRFEFSGRTDDINEAVTLCREAADVGDQTDDSKSARQHTLTLALRDRYRLTGNLSDLDEAIDVSREALRGYGETSSMYSYHSSLGNALRARFDRLGNKADIDDAIESATAALNGVRADDAAEVAIMQTNLANALRERFHLSGDIADLEHSIRLWRTALTIQGGPELRLGVEVNLANGLQDRYRALGDAKGLLEAIDMWRRALERLHAGSPLRAQVASNLGNALWDVYKLTSDASRLDQAVTMWTNAANAEGAPIQVRVAAACEMGLVASEEGDWALAAKAYATAIALLPVLAWRGTARRNRENQLTKYDGLASQGAAAMLAAGRYEEALACLEQGRAVLWSQSVETRTELTDLGLAAPHLLSRLETIRDQISGRADVASSDAPLREYAANPRVVR